jgi:hypothetical protein
MCVMMTHMLCTRGSDDRGCRYLWGLLIHDPSLAPVTVVHDDSADQMVTRVG